MFRRNPPRTYYSSFNVHIYLQWMQGYSTNIYIPSKTNVISEVDTSLRCELTPNQNDLVGVKLSEFPPITLYHLGKRIKKVGTSCLWSIPSNAALAGLFIICLRGLCGLSILLMAYQTTMHTYPSNYTETQIAHKHCLQSHKEYILPSTVEAS